MNKKKVIAITNQKGGVGKTTTSINLAAGLIREGKKACIIDLDPQGNATQGLGYDADNLDFTISTILKRIIVNKSVDFDIQSGILYHEEGIDLVPSNIELSLLETELMSMYFGREKVLKTYVNKLKEIYDYIIIDCLPSLNLIAINALVAANEEFYHNHREELIQYNAALIYFEKNKLDPKSQNLNFLFQEYEKLKVEKNYLKNQLQEFKEKKYELETVKKI